MTCCLSLLRNLQGQTSTQADHRIHAHDDRFLLGKTLSTVVPRRKPGPGRLVQRRLIYPRSLARLAQQRHLSSIQDGRPSLPCLGETLEAPARSVGNAGYA